MADQCEPRTMGLDYGLNEDDFGPKMKFRWLFKLKGISADDAAVSASLPPRRGSRPGLSWREESVQHVTETIWYPWKPDWKPLNLVLYDTRCDHNPVFEWIRSNENFGGNGLYDPQSATWMPLADAQFKRDAQLQMLDGCGNVIEEWTLENCWPSNIEWGELDMDSSEIATVELQIRFDRPYIIQ